MPEDSRNEPTNKTSESAGSDPAEGSARDEEQTDNPTPDGGIGVTLSVPETIEVRMVNAATLEDYEVWFFLASLAWGALTAFFVATLQASDQLRLPWGAVTIFVGLLFAVFVYQTFNKRSLLKKSSKTRAIPYIQAPKKRKRSTKQSVTKKKREIEHEPKEEG